MAELIIQQGVSIGIVIRLFIYYMPRLVVFTIPMSCLLAALLGFGKLSANSEIVALKSAGLSFQRIVRPVVAAAFVISICALVINESIVPMSERAAANVMKYEVLHESAPVFKAKVFLKEEGGGAVERVIYIDKMDNKTKQMENVVVEEFEGGRLARVIAAKTGEWISGSWWLTDGAVYEIKETKEVGLLFKFNRQALMLNMAPDEISANDRKPDEMTIPELLRAIEIRGKTGAEAGDLWMAFHLRLAVPWACLIFGILGAALGSRPQRSSSSVGLGFSVIRPLLQRKKDGMATNAERMIGMPAEVVEAIPAGGKGYVMADGVRWLATSGHAIQAGRKAIIKGIDGTTLAVEEEK